jgi:hypothetical protein
MRGDSIVSATVQPTESLWQAIVRQAAATNSGQHTAMIPIPPQPTTTQPERTVGAADAAEERRAREGNRPAFARETGNE